MLPPVTPYRVEPLGKSHDREGFSCGSPPLDRYLRQQARQDAEKRVAAPFVLIEPPASQVLGYYTLSASVVDASELPNTLARKLPRYPQLPVTLLGRLALDQGMKGRGAGEFLLMNALRRSLAREGLPILMPFPGPALDGTGPAPEAELLEILRRSIGYRLRLR